MTSFTPDEDWLPYHPSPVKPKFVVPDNAVDSHCHVFGPGDRFPYSANRKYTPCDAPKEQLWQLRDYLGFSRNVIVQATCHGADNSALVDALLSANGKARGVATIRESISDGELSELHQAGVRGVRFNFVKRLVQPVPFKTLIRIAERVKSLGWHIVIYFESQDLPELYDLIADLPTTVVVDHMGRPDVSKAIDAPGFQLFIRLMRENQHVWSKVSCPERISHSGPPHYLDVVPFSKTVIEQFPDRVLWGTDWPHPNMKSHMPDDGVLVDMIPQIAPNADLREKLLVENPLKLYWA